MHDFSTANADEMYYEELATRMRFFKQDERGVDMVSKIVEEYGDIRAAEALKLGIQQGEQKKAEETAINMLKKKYTPSDISEMTGLALKHVNQLQKQNNL